VPIALIWAVNTLFAAGIPYTFQTWLAALILSIWLRDICQPKP
jgi:hypothetical protein